MTATSAAGPRILTLDLLRGVAVMGILAMNIVAFAMPFQAYMNPTAYGGAEGADLWAWILAFVFVDGKMRAMFSLLFGASMLLVIERTQAAGGSGGSVHFRRMFWLLVFGLIHYFLIWYGDILTSYALVGMIAWFFTARNPEALLKWAIGFFVVGLLFYAFFFASPLALQAMAQAQDADPAVVAQWEAFEAEMGPLGSAALAENLAIYRGSWLGIVEHTVTDMSAFLAQGLIMFGPETLAFMLLGMWGLRSGFLTGGWEARRYRRFAAICLGIAIPAYAILAWIIVGSGFDVALTTALQLFAAAIFRPLMMLGYAALIVLVARHGIGALGSRVAAAGRAAFTNYLGTSIVATFLFYGWGLGLYGTLGRAETYLVVLGIWALMLLWSKPWLERYRYGPLEWLWRSLARGSPQPMRRHAAIPAAAE